MYNIRISKTQIVLICIVIFEAFFIKLFAYTVLPEKYFYDSFKIMGIMDGRGLTDSSFTFTAQFYDYINILGINTHEGWSIFLSLIGMITVIYAIKKNRKYTVYNTIYLLATVFFLNIYVFLISKDFIQYLFFLIIYIILTTNFSNRCKLLYVCLTLIVEALNFRIYYGIMAILFLTIYFLYKYFGKNKGNFKKFIIVSVIIFFFEIFIVSLVSPENYNSILHARFGVNIHRESSLDAVTVINDLLGENKNFIVFMGNYMINFIRMLFPVELLFKGVKYIPFIIYQIYITINLFRSLKVINDKNILWIATFLSYFIISVIFEPDFGSFIKHESSVFLIIQYLIYNMNDSKKSRYYNFI